ncbi:MAG: T9SS type A sorting domain-containing protein [Flavisolibacter sp.]
MKAIFTLIVAITAFLKVNAQAILNEVYCIPGSARQEFFEFYNNSLTPTSMDNYTIVTYFEAGGQKGFYVMDLPNLSVGPLGFFVGSSAVPFNYQGVTNSNNSQFSWNNLAFLAANHGYLRKWVLGNTVPASIDGNANYDLAPVPANFNDFFNKIGGTGATYNVFVFQNGLLQDVFLGGTGGSTFLPSYIVGLPSLYVDMSATAPDFTINFPSYGNVNPEYVIQDVGSDNGYIRLRDGFCGTWTKSSAQVNHSPDMSNGGDEVAVVSNVSVASALIRGGPATGSTLNYDVVAGPVNDFPVTMHIYLDNGTVPGHLDANDTYLTSQTEDTVSDGPFSSVFFPYTAGVIIQTTTSAGCIDGVQYIPNVGVLAIRLLRFQGQKSENGNLLKWTVDENESGRLFQIEKSTDGRNFSLIGSLSPSSRSGQQDYQYRDAGTSSEAYYRIRLLDKKDQSFYSPVVFIENGSTGPSSLNLSGNPVESYLSFSYAAAADARVTINIYNMAGMIVQSEKASLVKGNNRFTLATDGKLYTGAYVLELVNNTQNIRTKFLKR